MLEGAIWRVGRRGIGLVTGQVSGEVDEDSRAFVCAASYAERAPGGSDTLPDADQAEVSLRRILLWSRRARACCTALLSASWAIR